MVRLVVVITLICFCCIGDTNHYLGGTFNWRPLNQGKVEVSWTISWDRNVEKSLKPLFDCQGRDEIKGEGLLFCLNCSNPVAYPKPLRLRCVGYSIQDGYSLGRNSFVFEPRDKKQPLSKFMLSYQRSKNISRSSSYWRQISNYGGGSMYKLWRMMVDIDTTIENSSPIATFPPIYIVQYACGDVKIKISVYDPDGDKVRCRWASGPSECPPQIMNVEPVCGQISPHTIMDEDNCEYTFPVSSLTYRNPDYGNRKKSYWFAVPITIEDFRDGKRLSKVPLQYLIRVDKRVPSVCERPTLQIGQECLYLLVGEMWMLTVKADSSYGIRDIAILPGTTDITMFELNDASTKTSGFRKITWTPTAGFTGQHFIFIYAIDNNGYRSEYKTITVNVIQKWADTKIPETPEVTGHYPASNKVYDIENRFWNISFDHTIQRPSDSRYVTVFDDADNKETFKVDLSNETAVKINDRKTYHFYGPRLERGQTYRVVIDTGATESQSCDACTTSCARFPSKGVTFQVLTGEIVEVTESPSCDLILPEVDIGRNCTYIQVGSIWQRTITAVNTNGFMSLFIEGVNGMTISNGYLRGDLYVRNLSWKPKKVNKGRNIVQVIAIGSHGMSSLTEEIELIVVDQAPKDQDNISGPAVVTRESKPHQNEVVTSPITNITIAFDMKITKPVSSAYIHIQQQTTPHTVYKIDASGEDVTIDDVTGRKMTVLLPDGSIHGSYRVVIDAGVAVFLFCDICNSSPECNSFKSQPAQWEFHIDKCGCNTILQRLNDAEERLLRLESALQNLNSK
ncbi:uncharacterized protein [Antedon mediterranea]|uniref:uncharacterized protein n=1 Tax=Antedon mediterranea TaxID=105859 RepID=UPI003AF4B636